MPACAPPPACRRGRMLVLFLGGTAYLTAAGLQAGAQGLAMLYTGRAFVGIGAWQSRVGSREPCRHRHAQACAATAEEAWAPAQRHGAPRAPQAPCCLHPLRPSRPLRPAGMAFGNQAGPVWMSEVALPRYRGALTACYQFAVVIGAVCVCVEGREAQGCDAPRARLRQRRRATAPPCMPCLAPRASPPHPGRHPVRPADQLRHRQDC